MNEAKDKIKANVKAKVKAPVKAKTKTEPKAKAKQEPSWSSPVYGDLNRVLFEQAAEGVFVADSQGRYLAVNPRMTELTGYSAEEFRGMNITDLIPPEDLARDPIHMEDLRQGKIVRNERRIRRKDGVLLTVAVSGRMLSDGSLLVMVSDITERKQAEERLRKSNDRILVLADNVSGYIAYVNADTLRYEFVNSRFEKSSGMPREKIIGSHIKDVLGEQHYQYALPYIEAVKAGKSVSYETVFTLEYDKRRIQVHYNPIFDAQGRTESIAVLCYDITERKQAETELCESEEKYRRLIETTGTGYVIIDEQGRVIDANQEYVRLTGRSQLEELIGHTVMEWTAPYDFEHNTVAVRKCVEQGFIRNLEIDYVTPTGQFNTVEINATVLHASGALQILTLCRNINERKRAEEALRESESKYRELFENMINAFSYHKIILDEEGKPIDYMFLEVNSAFEKLTGLKRTDILGKRVTEVLPGIENDPADWIGTYGNVALTGKDIRFEQHSEQLEKWYSVLAYCPVKGCFATIFEDITERRRAEEALRANENFLESIFRAAPTGIGVVSNRVLMSVNDRICEMTGYT